VALVGCVVHRPRGCTLGPLPNERSKLPCAHSKIHESRVTGVSPCPTARRQRQTGPPSVKARLLAGLQDCWVKSVKGVANRGTDEPTWRARLRIARGKAPGFMTVSRAAELRDEPVG
jgi:hypothetical protein